MSDHKVVIGASAGGVEALRKMVSGLPENFPGSLFVVVHIGNSPSALPEILSCAGPLAASHPEDGEPIRPGRIYVAPPDYHMLLGEQERIRLSHGPKENHTRPAINPLFRSAAEHYGPDVSGVILSGTLDDGVLGLAEIKRKGGIAIVQDPKTALFTSMPSCAIECVPVDYVVPVEDIPPLLSRPIRNRFSDGKDLEMKRYDSDLTCPECRGPLTEFRSGKLQEFRCRVGHAYSALALAQEHQDTLERKLWESVLALEESAEIADQLGMRFGGLYKRQANDRREQAVVVRDILSDLSVRMAERRSAQGTNPSSE